MVAEGKIKKWHCESLLKLDDADKQKEWANKVAEKELSVKELRDRIKKELESAAQPTTTKNNNNQTPNNNRVKKQFLLRIQRFHEFTKTNTVEKKALITPDIKREIEGVIEELRRLIEDNVTEQTNNAA